MLPRIARRLTIRFTPISPSSVLLHVNVDEDLRQDSESISSLRTAMPSRSGSIKSERLQRSHRRRAASPGRRFSACRHPRVGPGQPVHARSDYFAPDVCRHDEYSVHPHIRAVARIFSDSAGHPLDRDRSLRPLGDCWLRGELLRFTRLRRRLELHQISCGISRAARARSGPPGHDFRSLVLSGNRSADSPDALVYRSAHRELSAP